MGNFQINNAPFIVGLPLETGVQFHCRAQLLGEVWLSCSLTAASPVSTSLLLVLTGDLLVADEQMTRCTHDRLVKTF